MSKKEEEKIKLKIARGYTGLVELAKWENIKYLL